MMFDREKAREVLASYGQHNGSLLLDALAGCVTDDPPIVEGRDWVGNPDGTLVYWQREAEEARAKAAALEQKFRRWVAEAEAKTDDPPTIDRDALIEFMLQIGASDWDHARRRATYIETVCMRPDPRIAKLEPAIIACAPLNMELRMVGGDLHVDRAAEAYLEGVHAALDAVREVLRGGA